MSTDEVGVRHRSAKALTRHDAVAQDHLGVVGLTTHQVRYQAARVRGHYLHRVVIDGELRLWRAGDAVAAV